MQRTALARLLLGLYVPVAVHAQTSTKSDANQKSVDLRPLGFPDNPNPVSVADVKASVFFLSNEILALYFEQHTSGVPLSHNFKFLTFNTNGQIIAQRVFEADSDLLDVSDGPMGNILVREAGRLDVFDPKLQLVKAHSLPFEAIAKSFDRSLNQLVIVAIGPTTGNRDAHFLEPGTFNELKVLTYPKDSRAIFGKNQLTYNAGGICAGALHFRPDPEGWRAFDSLQSCDALTFVGTEALAYATNQDLYVVHKSGRQLFHGHIPAPSSFHLPDFVGLSDDHSRLAISAVMKRGLLRNTPGTWPYYDEVYVYDLTAKKLLLKHALMEGYAAGLSPDGHRLATIESGSLNLLSIP
jgi:hypothetical protein